MSSIGPQLPPHLTKRKRTPEEDDDDNTQANPGSPPSKNQRTHGPVATNGDEIDLADDSDGDSDGYGPKPVTGPSMPPGNKDEIDLASDSDSDVGPAPPKPPSAGPAPAPRAAAQEKDDHSSSSSYDDNDDDYGPSLPTASTRPQIGPSLPPSAAEDDTPQRDSWMLAPPTSGPFSERDTTKIRARKFASGKPSGGTSSSSSKQPSSIWTETAEEKLRRLQDSVLGRSSGPDQQGSSGNGGRNKEAEERDRKIAANIEASRGKSLYEEHSLKRKEKGVPKGEEEDDPSKRAFDREKDMALGGGLGSAKRKELVNKSANFGGRFQKGSYL